MYVCIDRYSIGIGSGISSVTRMFFGSAFGSGFIPVSYQII